MDAPPPPPWKKQLAKELLKPKRNRFPRRNVHSKAVDEIWTADLVDMHRYASVNKGYKYILVVVDVFSRYAFARPLKAKTGANTAEALRDIFQSSGRTPRKLWTDCGTEFYNANIRYLLNGPQFYNDSVEGLLQERDIQLYSTHNEPKAMIAERFIRTLRGKIESNFIVTQSTVWYNVLPRLISEYNTTRHRSIKMTPEDACKPENFLRVYGLQEQRNTPTQRKRFNVGDRVRISRQKKLFEKGATPNWSEEIFEICEAIPTRPVTYKIKDLAGEVLQGAFYTEQLQQTDQEIYRVDKVLRRRKRHGISEVYVRWSGYPDKFNQWIPAADVQCSGAE